MIFRRINQSCPSSNSISPARLVPDQSETIGTCILGGVRGLLENIAALFQSDRKVLLETKTNLDLEHPVLSLSARHDELVLGDANHLR